jgi:transcriptional regulator with XRE-family HTH domain
VSVNVNIGERLREERERLGYTQADFADQMDVGRTTQLNYETGVRSPDAAYLSQASSIGMDINYVVTGHRGTGPVEKFTAKARGLMQAFDAAEEDVRDAIFTLATKAAGAGGDVATPRRRRGGAVFHGPVGTVHEVGDITGMQGGNLTVGSVSIRGRRSPKE